MALFRRRGTSDEAPGTDLHDVVAPDDAPDLADDELQDASDAEPAEGSTTGASGAAERSGGPFDESQADLADPELPRLDLGSLLIPGLPGIGVQVEADPETNEVRAVTAVASDGAVQVQAFAAPRNEGIWDEIRAEMLAEITATANATVTEAVGAFGPELRAVIPARSPEGKQVRQALRFTGIDGPRWFVRAVFLGRAAVEPDPDDELHTIVREMIVVRGGDAMAPRDPLPLRLPQEPPDAMVPADELGLDGGESVLDDDLEDLDGEEPPNRFAGLDPFERGPEITEVR